MSEQPPTEPQGRERSALRERFQSLAGLVRASGPLPQETQTALADLLEEMGREVDPAALPPAEAQHLADSLGHLEEALRQPQDEAGRAAVQEQLDTVRERLVGVKDRLTELAARAQAEAPVATGFVLRLIDALATLGI